MRMARVLQLEQQTETSESILLTSNMGMHQQTQ